MKTLSIRQPYASLIAEGIKNIENRSFKTKFRGEFLIHASGLWHDRLKTGELFTKEQVAAIIDSNKGILEYRKYCDSKFTNPLPNSAIIGKATLVDCVQNHDSVWAERLNDQVLGEFYEKPIWNWVLEYAVLFDKPILNVKGKLSFWEYDIEKCHCCNKTSAQEEIFKCERCEHDMCSDCQSPYNQFSQIDFNCCIDCYND